MAEAARRDHRTHRFVRSLSGRQVKTQWVGDTAEQEGWRRAGAPSLISPHSLDLIPEQCLYARQAYRRTTLARSGKSSSAKLKVRRRS